METGIIKVPIGKIEFTTDRTFGGEGNIDVLAQSIKAVGIIHPPAVKEIADKQGCYRIIAGRRRYLAAKALGWKTLEVIVHPEKADEEAIALAENVNREDLHPLDEAEKFKHEIDSGKSVEEVAKYYARSVSGIQQRVRLTKLIDGVKTMFRDGKINLSGAALIASIPESDQGKFLKKYAEKKVDKWEITNFIGSVQRLKIKHIADKKCEKCKNRTFISTPGLFEDYTGLEDVCFDSECYAGKWKSLIGKLISKESEEQTGKTDNKIILNRGIPDFIPKKTKVLTIDDVEYSLLSQSEFSWKETKKKSAANTAWLVSLEWFQTSGSYDVKVMRIEYSACQRVSYARTSSAEEKDPVKTFYIDLLPDIKPEEKKEVAEKMQKKHQYPWSFFREVNERIMATIIDNRLRAEDKENMTALYLENECGGTDSEGKYCEIDPDYQALFDMVKIFGEKPFKLADLPAEPWVEKMFRVLIAISVKTDDLPNLRDTDEDWKATENTLFWRFAQITREEYIAYYTKLLTEAIRMETSATAQAEEPQGDEPSDDEGEVDNLNSEGEDMSDVDNGESDPETDIGNPPEDE